MTQNEIVVGLKRFIPALRWQLRRRGLTVPFDEHDLITEITHSLTRPQRAIDNDEPNRICSRAARVPPEDRSATTVVVNHSAGTQYVATVRRHEVRVDQALDSGGTDEAPSPGGAIRWPPVWPTSPGNTWSVTAWIVRA